MGDISVADQRAVLHAWVRRRHPEEEPSWTETHVSILAFAGDRVWKLKKAVALPFVDLSTRELRRRQCEREVSLNRRFAPDVYLDVVPLDDEAGRVVDSLVEMRRMPDDRQLASLAASGSKATRCLDQVADLLTRFHAAAPSRGPIDACATRDAVEERWEQSISELGGYAGSILAPGDLDSVARLARSYLAGRAPLFDARIAAGRVRDGHGDLLADDIFCLPDGPRVLDCLEFDDHLRFGDVLADVAFLAMDLERLGRADLARRFLDRYAQTAGESWPQSLEHLYVAYRAVVRSKVACLRTTDDETAAERARQLLALARDHLQFGHVRLVLIGGPPGTGKTTLARALARELRWPVLHSDEIRKDLAGVTSATHDRGPVDEGFYAGVWTRRTYDALCVRARARLEHGYSVVLDASWSDPPRRAQAREVAASASADLVALRCSVSPPVAAARVAARAAVGTDASDATGEIAESLAARFAAWPEASVVDTTPPPEVVTASVVALLRSSRPRPLA